MNTSFQVYVLWKSGDDEVVYDGKWESEARQAGQDAYEKGAVFVDLYRLENGEVQTFSPLKRQGW
jgi:hypothetical protein